jgi:DNA-binding NtrC family response regulator
MGAVDIGGTVRLAEALLGNPFAPGPDRAAAEAQVAELAEDPAPLLGELVRASLVSEARRIAVAIGTFEQLAQRPSRVFDPRVVPEKTFVDMGLLRQTAKETTSAAARCAAAIRRIAGESAGISAVRAAAWKACFGESVYEAIRLRPIIREQNVLVLGETGTGKELVAQAIASADPEAGRAQTVNAGAIPRDLLESELFGHAKGAFTGAVGEREGKIVAADRGTLFLDEIADLPLDLQAKLLRVVEDGQVTPIGSNRSRKVDVRYVCATSQPLAELVERGRFRRDLHARLAGITLTIPPLRTRPEDLVPIADELFRRYGERLGEETGASTAHLSKLTVVQARARAWLATEDARRDPWKGNVRELQSLMRRWILGFEEPPRVAAGREAPREAAADEGASRVHQSLARFVGATASLREVEDWYILHVLGSVEYHQRRAADILGIDRGTLARRLRQIDPTSNGE